MRVGITGHQRLSKPANWTWVRDAMDQFLEEQSQPLIGFSCLAVGADSLFAERILNFGGELRAVIPFNDYESRLDPQDRSRYSSLLASAAHTMVSDASGESDEEAYFAAGKKVVELAEVLIAVWDGRPAKGLGGTADIVEYARNLGKSIHHLDPYEQVVRSGNS